VSDKDAMPPGDALPTGQILTRRFPVVGERAPPGDAPGAEEWTLHIHGLVRAPVTLSLPELLALPQAERTVDIHCVTGWSKRAVRLVGIPLSRLFDDLHLMPSARFVRFVARSERDHDTSLPLSVALADTWLVHTIDGESLTPAHGGPLRTVTPSRYFYKSLKWVSRIEVMAEDRLGYWERESAYHNTADPTRGDQRYRTGSLDPARLARFLAAGDYARWRGPKRLILSADLRAWRPVTRELGELHLKDCDLRGVVLAGADLRGANLTRCDLRGADLRGVDLRDADLEGVVFVGADLRGADLRGAFLSAARFFDEGAGARVDGLRLEGADGLLEGQEAWLLSRLDSV